MAGLVGREPARTKQPPPAVAEHHPCPAESPLTRVDGVYNESQLVDLTVNHFDPRYYSYRSAFDARRIA
jgi:hypothetical protein